MADHLFFSEVGEGSVERTVLIMLWHVKEANQLIQAKVALYSRLTFEALWWHLCFYIYLGNSHFRISTTTV